MASTRSTSAATLLTLWSTSSTARPSSRKPPISSEKAATSPAVRPAKGSSTSTTFGSRAIALASSSRRRSANGRVGGPPVAAPRRGRRARRSRGRGSSTCGSATSRSSESGSSASLMFSQHGLPVQRARVLEHDADAVRARCGASASRRCRRRRAATAPAFGRSMPMISFITVDLPEPFGPIRPRISPGADREADVLDGDQAAEALGQPADLADGAAPLIARPPAAQRVAEQAVGEEQDHRERDGGDHEGVELAERAQHLARHDQEDGAEHAAEDRAPAAEHGGDDDLHADRRCRPRCRPRRCP